MNAPAAPHLKTWREPAAVTYDAVDRSGRDPNARGDRHADGAIVNAVATDVGVDNDPIETGGGFIWYDVAGIPRTRSQP